MLAESIEVQPVAACVTITPTDIPVLKANPFCAAVKRRVEIKKSLPAIANRDFKIDV
jgi:hypothetical protein